MGRAIGFPIFSEKVIIENIYHHRGVFVLKGMKPSSALFYAGVTVCKFVNTAVQSDAFLYLLGVISNFFDGNEVCDKIADDDFGLIFRKKEVG